MVAEIHPSGMAGPTPIPESDRRRPRRARRVLLALVLVLVLAWVARDAYVPPLLTRLAAGLAADRGWKLEIGGFDGISTHALGVSDVRATPLDPSSPVQSLQAGKISCEFGLGDLLRGRARGLRAVTAEGVEVEIDLARSTEAPTATPGMSIELPEYLPRVEVARSSVRLRLKDGQAILLEGIEAQMQPGEREGTALAHLVVGRAVAPWSIGSMGPRVELTATCAPGELRIEKLHVQAADHRIEANHLRMPLAFADTAELLGAITGEISVDSPDPVALALGHPIEAPLAGHLTAKLHLEAGALVVDSSALAVPGGSLEELRGSLDLAAIIMGRASTIELAAEAKLEDLAPWGEVLGLQPWAGRLEGRVRLAGDLRAPRLRVWLSGDGVSIAARPLGAVDLEAETDFHWIQVDSFLARGDAGELDLRGGVDLGTHALVGAQLRAHLVHPELLHAAIPPMELVLEARVEGPWNAPSGALLARAPELELAGSHFESLLLDARMRDGSLQLALLVGATPLGALEASGAIDLAGHPRSIELEVASLDRASADGADEDLLSLCLDLPEAHEGPARDSKGELSLLARVRWPAGWMPGVPVPGAILDLPQDARIDLDLAGSLHAPRGELTISVPAVSLTPTLEGAGTAWTGALDARVRIDHSIVLEGLEVAGGTGEVLHASGRSSLDPDLEQLFATGGGTFLDAPFELDVRGELSQLSWLASLSPEIRRTSGVVQADAHFEGTPRAPRSSGALHLREGELRLASGFPTIERIEGEFVFEERRILVQELGAEIGSAPLTVNGAIDLETESPTLELSVHGESVLLARTSTVRLRTNADLRISGTLAKPRLTGKIDLQKGRVRRNVEFLSALRGGRRKTASSAGFTAFSLREPPLSELELDVEISASEGIDLESNIAHGSIRPALRLAGTGAIPTLEGRVFLDDLRVDLPGGRFRFSAGVIQFDRADPFRPTLDFLGQTRLAGHDVTMEISGPIDEPIVNLSSSPPVSKSRLFLLVVSGTLPPEDLQGSGSQATRSVSIYVAKDMLSRWLSSGSEDDEDSLFSRIEIVTGSEVSKAGVLSTQASLRLREGAFVEDDTMLLVAERDVYEDYNMGVRIVFHFR